MADISLLLEAEKRGILPPEKQSLLAEARSRGLVPALATESGVPSGRSVGGTPSQKEPPMRGSASGGLIETAISGLTGLGASAVGGLAGLVDGCFFLYLYVKWILSSQLGPYRLQLVHNDR